MMMRIKPKAKSQILKKETLKRLIKGEELSKRNQTRVKIKI